MKQDPRLELRKKDLNLTIKPYKDKFSAETELSRIFANEDFAKCYMFALGWVDSRSYLGYGYGKVLVSPKVMKRLTDTEKALVERFKDFNG